jgi:hypothetical protein
MSLPHITIHVVVSALRGGCGSVVVVLAAGLANIPPLGGRLVAIIDDDAALLMLEIVRVVVVHLAHAAAVVHVTAVLVEGRVAVCVAGLGGKQNVSTLQVVNENN